MSVIQDPPTLDNLRAGIYRHYGYRHQLLKLIEELSELQKATAELLAVDERFDNVNDYSCDIEACKGEMLLEIADVENMLGQVKLALGIKDIDVDVAAYRKCVREHERIKGQ